ncbi:MAG: hypothetical protein CBC63_02215 [Euryarchaeota archaeon TMED103]|nr:MAG: hypothetical protein CBC63_02215 [Euryarchaeota archaeon TMED103]|tara:strand:- start:3073 stop:3327 length:255 start_codon:yes stop_codon:yes gene_type:complete
MKQKILSEIKSFAANKNILSSVGFYGYFLLIFLTINIGDWAGLGTCKARSWYYSCDMPALIQFLVIAAYIVATVKIAYAAFYRK